MKKYDTSNEEYLMGGGVEEVPVDQWILCEFTDGIKLQEKDTGSAQVVIPIVGAEGEFEEKLLPGAFITVRNTNGEPNEIGHKQIFNIIKKSGLSLKPFYALDEDDEYDYFIESDVLARDFVNTMAKRLNGERVYIMFRNDTSGDRKRQVWNKIKAVETDKKPKIKEKHSSKESDSDDDVFEE